MKCEECLPLLDLYADGELSPREAYDVAAHLGACASCEARHRGLRREQALYLSYECEPPESPAFWDDVLTNIRAEKARPREAAAAAWPRRLASLLSALSAPRFSPKLTAALLLVAVVLTAAVMRYFGPTPEPPLTQRAEVRKEEAEVLPTPPAADEQGPAEGFRAAVNNSESVGGRAVVKKAGGPGEVKRTRKAQSSGVAEEASPDRLVRDAEQKYLAAIRILSRDVGRQRTRMDADTLARFERTLGVIDKSIAETRAAARRHPRDPVAVQYMLAAYDKKVEVLRDMARE
ncbi:MAG TPA: zf-HC2 domain-containing protein [Pyrinomonadaceae bacterium]|nr:zf-HC2 domain-containing protein [Pyrinomonadaceae bacterium]